MSDTVFALASGRGRAGVAVVRLSGPSAHEAVRVLAGTIPPARRLSLRRLRDPEGDVLDDALVAVFDPQASFTGEAAAELHLHGSAAVVAAVTRVLAKLPGLRPAEAGEFTRRALENGRLDLAQVEGLSDLIDAETEAQRRQALRVASGAVAARIEPWRSSLLRATALMEATIDFADEDVPTDVLPEVRSLLAHVRDGLIEEIAGFGAAERVRDGFEVAIVGRPNAGKSTLLNALAGRDVAITSAEPGTTRDIIELRLEIAGLAVTVLDMAGLREAEGPVERIGVARAEQRAADADLRIFLLDDSGEVPGTPAPGDIIVQGKADIAAAPAGRLAVSGLTGDGVAELVARIGAELSSRVARPSVITRERHRAALTSAAAALEEAITALDQTVFQAEILAENLRAALRALDSLIGRVDVEDVLGEIFARFCIGK